MRILRIFLYLQIGLFLSFEYFAFQADQAMDKSGIGNQELFQLYSEISGSIFLVIICIWLLTATACLVEYYKDRKKLDSVNTFLVSAPVTFGVLHVLLGLAL